METETIEATEDEVTEVSAPSLDVAVRTTPVAPATLATSQSVDEMIARVEKIGAVREKVMKVDVHYGVIPGTGKKPSLLKPGAEILAQTFLLDPQLTHTKTWLDDGHLFVDAVCVVYHAPTGTRLGRASGFCSTREEKYAWRKAMRVCPSCGEPQIRRSKHGEEWYCWKKEGGCGATFPIGDDRITSQDEGRVANPNLPDTYNTVIKMAEKRALIAAILITTGASSDFTQDVEDQAAAAETEAAEAAAKEEAKREPKPPNGWVDLLLAVAQESDVPEVINFQLFRAACSAQFGVDPKGGAKDLGQHGANAKKATQATLKALWRANAENEEQFLPVESIRTAWKAGFPAFEPPDAETLGRVIADHFQGESESAEDVPVAEGADSAPEGESGPEDQPETPAEASEPEPRPEGRHPGAYDEPDGSTGPPEDPDAERIPFGDDAADAPR
jgi:hypothetical protein